MKILMQFISVSDFIQICVNCLISRFPFQMLKTMADSIPKALQEVHERMLRAVVSRKTVAKDPVLVAVSKTKPIDLILEAYQAGQRHFGENYVQELLQKSNDSKIISHCPDIKWHFIGHLQRNKCNKMIGVRNLWLVETIDTIKLAEALNVSLKKNNPARTLNIMLEINTSRESNKHGFQPESVVEAASFVREKCPALKLTGLMTIGAVEHSADLRPNPDFMVLKELRTTVCQKLNLPEEDFELSMGMSSDFEHAIEMGSTEVRVGSLIFGSRVYESNHTESGDE